MMYTFRHPWNGAAPRRMAHCEATDWESTFPVDVQETDDAYLVFAALPGVKSERLSIEITGEQLKIQAAEEEETEKEERYLLRERPTGRFSRTLLFRSRLSSEGAEAELKDGILKLHIPKAEESKPKSVKVTLA